MNRRCSTRSSTPATRAAAEGALGGFLALGPDLRDSFRDGLPILMQSQFEQVFGGPMEGREQFYQDWAKDAETCSALDRERGREEARTTANPLLRRPLWGGRLHLGGSETGSRQAGYMEGALEAAQRIARDIVRDSAARRSRVSSAGRERKRVQPAHFLGLGRAAGPRTVRRLPPPPERQPRDAGARADHPARHARRGGGLVRRGPGEAGGVAFDLARRRGREGPQRPHPAGATPLRRCPQATFRRCRGLQRHVLRLVEFPRRT